MNHKWRVSLGALLVVTAGLYAGNNNRFYHAEPGQPQLLAHRGFAQGFTTEGLTSETCTAARMVPAGHDYLENTIRSMRAAFEAGADIVELDVHPTSDGDFAVFHDWTIDCRTEGHGVTREQSMAYLRTLDIGYGYTADGGKSFPFRGKGVGQMPALGDVMATFPDGRFFINIKSRDPQEGHKLAAFLGAYGTDTLARLTIAGSGAAPVAALLERRPDIRAFSKQTLKACLKQYEAIGWTGLVPDACRHTTLMVPINIGPWLWGWPNRFVDRMRAAGTDVVALGPYGGGHSSGIDTAEELAALPEGFTGIIWTNEIGPIAGLMATRP
ncbi:MAG: glycerophosphodiester phosphodiesterase [Alphaproteobacteria bacterium]|nr:MAG: glycerophosphodiester phosphodiesterase [Alphaproteobacteria bacterium]